MGIFIILIGSLNLYVIYNIILIAPIYIQLLSIIGGIWMIKQMMLVFIDSFIN